MRDIVRGHDRTSLLQSCYGFDHRHNATMKTRPVNGAKDLADSKGGIIVIIHSWLYMHNMLCVKFNIFVCLHMSVLPSQFLDPLIYGAI